MFSSLKVELAKNSLEEKVALAETEINQINQLVVNVQQDVGDVSATLNKTRDSIKNLRKCLLDTRHLLYRVIFRAPPYNKTKSPLFKNGYLPGMKNNPEINTMPHEQSCHQYNC